MILTGKCREDFEYKYNMSNFNELDEYLQFCRMVEFFDSVGIFINTPPFYDSFLKYNRGFECFVVDEINNTTHDISNDNDVFNSRQEALEQAIIKANEIYNKNEKI